MSTRIGPNSPKDARPESYWDGGGTAIGSVYCQRMPPATPFGLVGEHLTPLSDGEVEIVMIGMYSAMGDVISVRARRDGKRIRYRIEDEVELGNEIEFKPWESALPLTFNELTNLLWSIVYPGWGHLFIKHWEESIDKVKVEDCENDFYELSSDFYTGLQEWLDERFEEWKSGHALQDGD